MDSCFLWRQQYPALSSCCIFHTDAAVNASIYTDCTQTHTHTLLNTLSFFRVHKLTTCSRPLSHTHTHTRHHLLSVCLVDTHIRPGRRCVVWTIGPMMKALRCKWRLNYLGQSVGGVCVWVCAHLCVCGGFTQRAPGSRALQWLVKTPSRALGFELAFCQPSCQREAGNTERVCVCYKCVHYYPSLCNNSKPRMLSEIMPRTVCI